MVGFFSNINLRHYTAAEEVATFAEAHDDFPHAFICGGGVAPLARLGCAGAAALAERAAEPAGEGGADGGAEVQARPGGFESA